MGENEVFPTCVQIEGLPEFLHRHYGTFNVPAGATGADAALPEGFARLGSLPQGKVASVVLFIFVDIDSGAVLHSGKVFFRQFAVGGETGNAEIIRSVLGPVGKTLL